MPRRRISWDEVWMGTACWIAQRSACTVFQAGAVIVDASNRIRSTGYNGPPRDMSSARLGRVANCADDCPRGRGEVGRTQGYGAGCISVHAEANALLFADRSDIDGGTIYVNGISCMDCAKLIANSGLRRVVELDDHAEHRPASEVRKFFQRCGLEFAVAEPPQP